MRKIAFFNNKGGVGKTTLVYHLAWMFADLGHSVVAADLDPQSNLTSMFIEEERLEELWPAGRHPKTIQGVIDPILRGTGDIRVPHVEPIAEKIGLLPGDLALSTFEDNLSDAWPRCHNQDESAFLAVTAFYPALTVAAEKQTADVVLVDVGPNLGAINRSALIACQHLIIPLAADLLSLQGLLNLGPRLIAWRHAWQALRPKSPDPNLLLPDGAMRPAGYVLMQPTKRADRPANAFVRWMGILGEYRRSVLMDSTEVTEDVTTDPYALASLKHYRSIMPLSMEARKPMFYLKPADGAIGAHGEAVRDCYRDFKALAQAILTATDGDKISA